MQALHDVDRCHFFFLVEFLLSSFFLREFFLSSYAFFIYNTLKNHLYERIIMQSYLDLFKYFVLLFHLRITLSHAFKLEMNIFIFLLKR